MRTIASLDNAMQEAILQDAQAHFSQVLHQLVRFVREQGHVVPAEALVKSDVIIPSADMTLHEARRYLGKTIPEGSPGGEADVYPRFQHAEHDSSPSFKGKEANL